MASITVKDPGAEDGAPIEVLFLGVFPNGSTTELTDEQVALYKVLSGNDTVPTLVPVPTPESEPAKKPDKESEPPVVTTPILGKDK